jgi:hypothetical protein
MSFIYFNRGGNTLTSAKFTMATTANFSQSELVELIWTNRDVKSFSVKKKDLQTMDVEQLLAIAEENSIDLSAQEQSVATPDLSAVGVRAGITNTGATVHLMDLTLTETDGVTAYFQYQDKRVMISSDLHLVKALKIGALKVGDTVPFHYHGANTWKPLSMGGSILVPNNKGERAQEHSSSGTIAKTFCEPIQTILEQERSAKKAKSLDAIEVAQEFGLSIRQVRRMDLEDRIADARSALKARRAERG